MGTNYFMMHDRCAHCGREERMHIGKKSAGWRFSFRGHDNIRSWVDWMRELSRSDVLIRNEHGDVVSLEQFIKVVESSKEEPHDHIDYCINSSEQSDRDYIWRKLLDNTAWHDNENFSFSATEFS